MAMSDKTKLRKMFLTVMDSETMSKQEFLDAFENVVNLVLKIQKKNDEDVEEIKAKVDEFRALLETNNAENFSEHKKEMADYMASMMRMCEEKLEQVNKKMSEMKDGEDGEDADEERIKQAVLAEIKLPEQKAVILDTPEQVRDKLESLTGNERLNQSAIAGLQEQIESLKQMISSIPRGGRTGMRKIPIIKRYNLSSQCNGVLKTFTLPNDTVDVLGVFGTQFPVNFNPGTDWTFAGRTLTLTDAVGAPETGQTLFAIVETLFYG